MERAHQKSEKRQMTNAQASTPSKFTVWLDKITITAQAINKLHPHNDGTDKDGQPLDDVNQALADAAIAQLWINLGYDLARFILSYHDKLIQIASNDANTLALKFRNFLSAESRETVKTECSYLFGTLIQLGVPTDEVKTIMALCKLDLSLIVDAPVNGWQKVNDPSLVVKDIKKYIVNNALR